jgi:Domain of unknown function (DUF4878)
MRKCGVGVVLLLVLASCGGVMGLIDTPEGVANAFLRDLYHLDFDKLAELCTDDALYQAALLQGHSDAYSLQEKQRYALSTVLVKEFSHEEGSKVAYASYVVRFQDGQEQKNRITLTQTGRKWQVSAFEQPLVRPHIYVYFEG